MKSQPASYVLEFLRHLTTEHTGITEKRRNKAFLALLLIFSVIPVCSVVNNDR